MTNRRRLALPLLLVLLGAGVPGARAQSTDGYHAIQVFPLVVDSASFTQQFQFRSVYPWDTTDVTATFYPAQGTAQAGPLACNAFAMLAGTSTSFSSLRNLCPGIAPGSAFGTLVVRSDGGLPFAAASRISNPAGNGFQGEAFPASDFTSADTVVTGLKRLAAKPNAPAFQSNCFVGNLAAFAPTGAPVTSQVYLHLSTPAGSSLGDTVVSVQPGQLVRLLDVFAAAGVPAGDVEDAVAEFSITAEGDYAGLMAFCTVQDNSSYGADFRIGKQESAWGVLPGAQDWGAQRWTYTDQVEPIDGETEGAPLTLAAGATRNVHVFYFRHPDVISCYLYGADPTVETTPSDGLEMRLRVLDPDGWHVVAGGNGAISFYGVYLGDKPTHGEGANTRYQLEVESNGQNEANVRGYSIACSSGSGHTQGERIRTGLPATF